MTELTPQLVFNKIRLTLTRATRSTYIEKHYYLDTAPERFDAQLDIIQQTAQHEGCNIWSWCLDEDGAQHAVLISRCFSSASTPPKDSAIKPARPIKVVATEIV